MQGLYSTINIDVDPLCFSSSTQRIGRMGVFYEHKSQRLIPQRQFLFRLLRHFFLAFAIIVLTLSVGVVGYLVWGGGGGLHDAILNAAFVMGGLGIVEVPETSNGKLFYAFYGIFVGLSFAASVGIVLAPVAHRVLHLLHLDDPVTDEDRTEE